MSCPPWKEDGPGWKRREKEAYAEADAQAAKDAAATIALRVRGTVKWFDPQKGFGFILRGDNGEDLFAHRTEIYAKNPNHYVASLAKGEEVEFDVAQGRKGLEAWNITGPHYSTVVGNDQAASGGVYGSGRSFGGGCLNCGEPSHFTRECRNRGGRRWIPVAFR